MLELEEAIGLISLSESIVYLTVDLISSTVSTVSCWGEFQVLPCRFLLM